MPPTLLYLTHTFPCPDDIFPINELPFLSNRDWQVIVIPCGRSHSAGPAFPLPSGIRCDLRLLGYALAKLARILTPTALRLLHMEWSHRHMSGQRFSWFAAIKACASAAFARQKLRQIILENQLESQPLVIYSFWFSHHAMAMPLLKAEFSQIRFVSRAHGIDIYPERHPYDYLPFYKARARTPDVLVPCSQDGLRTFLAEGVPKERLILSHLGVTAGPSSPCPASAEGELALVSCSSLLPVKRVPLLVQRLADLAQARPQLHITWHHLGDGPEAANVRESVERWLRPLTNIIPRLHGQLLPKDVRAFLAGSSCPLDVLVNVSSSEGLPVSMMEALAAGLPVVGPAVGGVAEIVTAGTGILLPPTCDSEAFIRAMDAVGAWKKPEWRRYNQTFFATHFQMDINYRHFVETVLDCQFSLSLSLLGNNAHTT